MGIGRQRLVGNLHGAGLTVDFEEGIALALVVGLADGQKAHHERFAAFM